MAKKRRSSRYASRMVNIESSFRPDNTFCDEGEVGKRMRIALDKGGVGSVAEKRQFLGQKGYSGMFQVGVNVLEVDGYVAQQGDLLGSEKVV